METTYIVQTSKTPGDAVADLESAIKERGYGVLHTYDLKATLTAKGFPLEQACHILEVCNPRQASAVLAADMGMNMALPCRISVYEQDGKTRIGMVRPTALLAALSSAPGLASIASQVEQDTIAMIDAAK